MRVGALLRRTDMSLLDRWYAAIGRELHTLGGKPHDPAEARRLLSDIGADAGVFDAALGDSTTQDEIHDDHQRVIEAGGFGVPTLFLLGQCLFGPVLVDPPTGPRSLVLWSVVTGMAGLPHVYELQRPKAPADLELIGRTLRPYLDGAIGSASIVVKSSMWSASAAEDELLSTRHALRARCRFVVRDG